jgi:ABC-type phosphate/phosphonate transport system substrate-binding protein
MSRKLVLIIVLTAMVVFCVNGCKKDSSQTEQDVKTAAEYKAEAKEQINKENMARELDELEKTLEEELSQEE